MDKIIVIDLEATCWENKEQSKDEVSEIIEIGICVLDIRDGSISQNKGILVKPKRSTVSTFCTQLTTITQQMIDDEGISFDEACQLKRSEYNGYQYTWASYGDYDINMMKRQCQIKGVDYPLSEDHINVKLLFSKVKGLRGKVGMSGALKALNIPLTGTHHRGIDDANNIAKILYWCLENGQDQ